MKTHLNVHYFQHIADEGLGSCEDYLKQWQAKISTTEFFALPLDKKLDIDALPDVAEIDLLIIMGGKMSVNDEDIYPWLITEKRWLRRFIALGKPVIGICLGGQMIANVLGAKVSQSPQKEIGWTQVYAVETESEQYFQLPHTFEIMQWHGETFALPKGATLLASNPACHHQAFQIGKNILAFQFHPEITTKTMALFLEDDEEVYRFTVHNSELKQELQLTLQDNQLHRYQQGHQILNQAIDYVLQKI
ncbi:MAG: type 1 glutamine amidotransferase [Acinetobacter sp.]|jgi:GMP synthase-like glutamine amidotransferase|nr:MAG: type 1 glutamine amidotransferase [Acinetobacter sp.]